MIRTRPSLAETTRAFPPDVASQIYTWADRPSNAVVLRNTHLANIALFGGHAAAAGLPIYQHGQRPCLYATIAGIIVGVSEKDHRWDYLVDDGSCVVDVSIHERNIPAAVAARARYGPTSSRVTLEAQPSRIVPTLNVGDLMRVTGKIWRQPMSTDKRRPRYRVGLDAHDAALLNGDPTAEARHNLEAHRLFSERYSKPFDAPVEALGVIHIQLPHREQERERLEERFSYDLRRLGGLDDDEDDDDDGKERKVAHNTLLPFRRIPKAERERERMARANRASTRPPISPSTKESQLCEFRAPRWPDPVNAPTPALTPPPPPSSTSVRQLRTPSKLKASQCTQHAFRLYVQKFLRDHCQRRWQAAEGDEISSLPPAFSLAFLMRVKSLCDLADRVVEQLFNQRDTKAAPRPARSSSSHATSSREPRQDKVRRLFEWCIRQLIQDGVIAIADEEATWPFDGGHQAPCGESWAAKVKRTRHQRKLLAQLSKADFASSRAPQWADVSMPLHDADDDHDDSTARKRAKQDTEAYQYVTPQLLLAPLLPILQGAAEGQELDVDVDWAVWRLRRSDQRWAHTGWDAVRDALALMARRGAS
ncbi:hypothetical protein BDZ90DRAFT_277908 [Jaminaea rosea]|uniref:CST complex subunit Stn1 N-terminal domain-containing protein n=1 Tax=Jaminaea rosea TaxID=1569628 RepID=A0A316UWH3_9BASI|nr:hypothetical protein BDZ90DRAFT_277908 [Jaminaea rosea]PWN29646.1 hypothetical protein BDZ90DRAFT_277908 [Jaminaea rosea]